MGTAGNLVDAVLSASPGIVSSPGGSDADSSPSGGSTGAVQTISRDVAVKVDGFISDLGDSLLKTLGEGESLALDSPSVSVRVSKLTSSPGQNNEVQMPFGDVQLPSDLASKGAIVSIKVRASFRCTHSYKGINNPVFIIFCFSPGLE